MKKFLVALCYTIIANIAIILITSNVDIESISIVTFFIMGSYFYKDQSNLLYKRIFSLVTFIMGSGGIIYCMGIGSELIKFYIVFVAFIALTARDMFKKENKEGN